VFARGSNNSNKEIQMSQSLRGSRARSRRLPRIAPTTRAIRSALALSATLVALSGSGVALAGTCTADPATNTVTCNGVFTDDVINSVDPGDVVVDLTLIVGSDGATTVDPTAGVNGITATWGNASVVSYADIGTVDADGVHLASNDATIANFGAIDVYTSAYGASAIDASTSEDLTVVNGGSLSVTSASDGVRAVTTYSGGGDIEIDNLEGASISADAGFGSDAIYADAHGNATVHNSGSIEAVSLDGRTNGVHLIARSGDVTLDNAGSIVAASVAGYAFGAVIHSYGGDALAYNSGSIVVDGGVDAAGLGRGRSLRAGGRRKFGRHRRGRLEIRHRHQREWPDGSVGNQHRFRLGFRRQLQGPRHQCPELG
jgi:hypothetical protein